MGNVEKSTFFLSAKFHGRSKTYNISVERKLFELSIFKRSRTLLEMLSIICDCLLCLVGHFGVKENPSGSLGLRLCLLWGWQFLERECELGMVLLIQKVTSAVHKPLELHICPRLHIFLFVWLISILTWKFKIHRIYKGMHCNEMTPKPPAQSLSRLNTLVLFHTHECNMCYILYIIIQTAYTHISLFPERQHRIYLYLLLSIVQLLSRVWLFETPWTAACQDPLSSITYRKWLKLKTVESLMPSNHLILCHPLLLLPSVFPSIRVFKWISCSHQVSKYWSFSFSISPSNEHSGLISFRIDWLELLTVQGTLKSLLQHHSSKESILRLSPFFRVQLSHLYLTTGKTIALTIWTLVGKVMSLLFDMLSRFVIAFLPRNQHLLILWLQSSLRLFWSPGK